MHSHCTMAVFFSATDHTYTNLSSQLQWHIVTNNKGEFNAVYKITLPCGKVTLEEVKVNILTPDIELKGLENITEMQYTYHQPTYDTIQDDEFLCSSVDMSKYHQHMEKSKKRIAKREAKRNKLKLNPNWSYVPPRTEGQATLHFGV